MCIYMDCHLLCVSVFRFLYFFQRLRVAQKTSTSIHLYAPRPDYILQRPLLTHTHKSKALASDITKP